MSSVTILILNTNRKADTLRCISSILSQDYGIHRVEVIVIDNGSQDGSVDEIISMYPNVAIIQTEVDKGYAGNNNFGFVAGAVQTDFTFILNEDTYFTDDSIRILLDFMVENDDVGICGPLILNESNLFTVQSNGGWINANCDSGFHNHCSDVDTISREPRTVDWVSGCALLVKSEIFRMLGGFWEPFYYTWEEVDLCKRVTKMGLKCTVVPTANIVHRDCPSHPSDNAWYYAIRNRILYIRRNYRYFEYLLLFSRTLARLVKRYIRSPSKFPPYIRQAVTDYILGHLGKRRV